ncbi:hypothetical protein ILUMI_04760 [Ignelater luminosus]|uniref:Uncharacterized protein n=1 Tax=Ignelater luminosus TaxID=2038154 RepID=A0A8K0DD91_IGNLU|nr:hypothetical protein ILUMI_04760 [Ignelater luminosus]
MSVLFKVWNITRRKKVFIVLNSDDQQLYVNLVLKASEKLELDGSTLVLESDGARLALTLRHLAAGDSIPSLAFAYRMGKSKVGNIINETNQIIWTVLHPTVLKEPNVNGKEYIDGRIIPGEWCQKVSQNCSLRNVSQLGRLGARNAKQSASAYREFIKDYFNSDVGAVPWQNEAIQKT